MHEKYESALLSIAGIAKDRTSTHDPFLLYLFLEEIERLAETALAAEDAPHGIEVPRAFRAAFEEDV